jgi:hypothetical protein
MTDQNQAAAPPLLSAAVLALPKCSLHVDIWIAPSNVSKFLEAFQTIFNTVTAEPELLYFEVFQDPDDAGHLSWVENWNASVEWLSTVCITLLSTLYGFPAPYHTWS